MTDLAYYATKAARFRDTWPKVLETRRNLWKSYLSWMRRLIVSVRRTRRIRSEVRNIEPNLLDNGINIFFANDDIIMVGWREETLEILVNHYSHLGPRMRWTQHYVPPDIKLSALIDKLLELTQ